MMKLDKSRYLKQELIEHIGPKGQKRLLNSKVSVVGCGALGSVITNTLARAGIGDIKIIDRDFIELDNLQRQVLFDEEDISDNLPKAIAAEKKLRKINSEINLEAHVAHINSENIEKLLKGSDIIIDGTDNFEIRFLINDFAVKNNIPWIYGGVEATRGMVFPIIPGKTPCLRCFLKDIPSPGLANTCDTVGVLSPIVNIIASVEASECIKILTGNYDEVFKKLFHFDVWSGSCLKINVDKGEAPCVTCDERKFEFLNSTKETETIFFCGQNSAQVMPSSPREINFESLYKLLKSHGEVKYNELMLVFKQDDKSITVFKDGRSIVRGIDTKEQALTLYSKYIGS